MTSLRIALCLAILALSACSPVDDSTPASGLSYYKDIKPIIDEHCVGCHQPGQIGSGRLDSYAAVRPLSGLVQHVVRERIMPPWLAGGECNDYLDDFSLDPTEIDKIVRWVDEGAVEGNPADDPGVPPLNNDSLSRVDYTLSMPAPYTPDASKADDYRCFVIDWPIAGSSYVTGFGVKTDNTSAAHHLIAYLAPPAAVPTFEELDAADPAPGYGCYGGPGGGFVANTSFIGAWAPGVAGYDFPAGTGIPIEPGSKVILQMHYNTVGWNGDTDQTSILLKVDDQVEKDGTFAFVANPEWVFAAAMSIPAGEPSVVHEASMDVASFLGGGVSIYTVGMHMHTRGTQAHTVVRHADGSDSCLIDLPRWDFDWQYGYRLATPARAEVGDSLIVHCQFDNSPENQPLVGGMHAPPHDINWGDGTDDEMCLAILYLTKD